MFAFLGNISNMEITLMVLVPIILIGAIIYWIKK